MRDRTWKARRDKLLREEMALSYAMVCTFLRGSGVKYHLGPAVTGPSLIHPQIDKPLSPNCTNNVELTPLDIRSILALKIVK